MRIVMIFLILIYSICLSVRIEEGFLLQVSLHFSLSMAFVSQMSSYLIRPAERRRGKWGIVLQSRFPYILQSFQSHGRCKPGKTSETTKKIRAITLIQSPLYLGDFLLLLRGKKECEWMLISGLKPKPVLLLLSGGCLYFPIRKKSKSQN